jgi:hypothetical protein
MTNMMSTMRREEEEVVEEEEEEVEEEEEDEFDAAAVSQHELALLCALLLDASRNNNNNGNNRAREEECKAIRAQIRAVRAKDARRAQALRLAWLVGGIGAETDAARAQVMARMLVLAAQASLLQASSSSSAAAMTVMMHDYFPNAMRALAAQHSRVEGGVWTTTADARAFHAAVVGPLEHDSARLI